MGYVENSLFFCCCCNIRNASDLFFPPVANAIVTVAKRMWQELNGARFRLSALL